MIATGQSLRYHDLSDDTVATLAEVAPSRDLGIEAVVDLGDGEVLALTRDGVRRYTIGGDLTARACDLFAGVSWNREWEFESIAGPPRACPR